MRKPIILIVILVTFVFFVGYVYSVRDDYHDFQGRCTDCHITTPGKGDKALTFVKDISFMCDGCHEDVKKLSHPVDVKPSMDVPSMLPLDWKGGITCITCHRAHKGAYGEAHLRVRARAQGFCMFCHSGLEDQLHKVGAGSAHLKSTYNAVFREGAIPGIVLDELSLKCMSCHDATFATQTLVENRAMTLSFHDATAIGLSHPIGVSYLEAKRKYHGAYRDIEDLPSQVKLFGGTVGCGSCHSPYSSEHAQLVMTNDGSALCLACHVK
ncbi:MAG: hypothetical protein BMS9Abin23_0106 [Thermodesulfobacteriota bacterium]|nr:MAG: hypothetical protein BMS9Abin23_0106 [Thermodesulfobacteriota bacterium]